LTDKRWKLFFLISDISQTEQNQRQLGAVEGIGDYWAAALESAARF
jgi:hypothetical protein